MHSLEMMIHMRTFSVKITVMSLLWERGKESVCPCVPNPLLRSLRGKLPQLLLI
ncbi:unnamed protein product [Moneuplotes crassus]|uniref:Uncharacterized protein n=1 Tax=Euplotes crassus TaxID=5936 RepID=A0AAD1Y171_EUPCR|nr:unnamed protein product [Moneuplotes crassus]